MPNNYEIIVHWINDDTRWVHKTYIIMYKIVSVLVERSILNNVIWYVKSGAGIPNLWLYIFIYIGMLYTIVFGILICYVTSLHVLVTYKTEEVNCSLVKVSIHLCIPYRLSTLSYIYTHTHTIYINSTLYNSWFCCGACDIIASTFMSRHTRIYTQMYMYIRVVLHIAFFSR